MNQADLRKAAILVSVLDTASADALLEQMGPAADRVRGAVMDLDRVSEAEQQQVIQEFLGRGVGGKNSGEAKTDEVTWDLPEPVLLSTPSDEPSPATQAAFAFLADADPLPLSAQLQRENPQIAAIVLAHLPAEQAAQVLQHLPTGMATDVLVRIANLDETHAEVLEDIERQLQLALAPYLRSRKSRTHGAARVGAILQSLPQATRGKVESALGRRDHVLLAAGKAIEAQPATIRIAPHSLAEELDNEPISELGDEAAPSKLTQNLEDIRSDAKPPPHGTSSIPAPQFSDLASLSDSDWQQLLQTAEEELILLAFAGAEPRLIDRVLKGFSRKQADYWRKQFAHPGPVRLREIDAAQARLAQLAAELADEGLLNWNSRRGVSAIA